MNRLLVKMPLLLLSGFALLGLTGCKNSRVVFVPESEGLIRIGPNVRGYVYYWNGSDWELSGNKVTIPEGWLSGSADMDEPSENLTQPATADNWTAWNPVSNH